MRFDMSLLFFRELPGYLIATNTCPKAKIAEFLFPIGEIDFVVRFLKCKGLEVQKCDEPWIESN